MAEGPHDHPASDPVAQSPMAGPTYLFACRSNESLGPSCVFYVASAKTLAESLERMFTSQYAEPDGWRFSHAVASVIPVEQQVLLDESLQWLDVYSEPDHHAYAEVLDEATVRRAAFGRQAAVWEELLRAKSQETRRSEPEAKPSPSAIADASLLAMILRDALFVQLDYPDAGTTPQHVALIKDVRERLSRAYERPGMLALKKLAASTASIADLADPLKWGALATAAAMQHPQFAEDTQGTPSDDQIRAATERAMRLCQSAAAPDIRNLADRLCEFMMVSCRRPTGAHDPSFKDPARATHMLDRYWRPASSLLHAQMKIHVGYSPHPLTRIIENLRDRIAWCFELLKDRPEAARVAEEADGLLSMLSEGDVDDLTAVEEWATPAIRRVELFIARAGMALGAWHGTLTQAETCFLSHIEPLVAEHTRDVSARWKRIVARADAIGATKNAERSAAPASAPSPESGQRDSAATGTPSDQPPAPPPPPSQPPAAKKGPRVVMGNRGEPCIVDGKPMPVLTDGQYSVIAALVSAGEEGCSKDHLERGVRKSARRMLEDLRNRYPEWAAVIQMAGQTNGRYRIRL